MYWKRLVSFAACLGAIGCTFYHRPAADDAAGVYAVVLRDFAKKQGYHGVVVSPAIAPVALAVPEVFSVVRHSALPVPFSDSLSSAALQQLVRVDSTVRLLEGPLEARLSAVERRYPPGQLGGRGRAIAQTLPGFGGVVTVSPVWASPLRRTVAVEVSLSCGFDCGEGWLYILRRVDETWQLVERQNTFMI